MMCVLRVGYKGGVIDAGRHQGGRQGLRHGRQPSNTKDELRPGEIVLEHVSTGVSTMSPRKQLWDRQIWS